MIMLVDRNELESQLFDNIAAYGLATGDCPKQAASAGVAAVGLSRA